MNYPLGDWLHNKISRQEYKEKWLFIEINNLNMTL